MPILMRTLKMHSEACTREVLEAVKKYVNAQQLDAAEKAAVSQIATSVAAKAIAIVNAQMGIQISSLED